MCMAWVAIFNPHPIGSFAVVKDLSAQQNDKFHYPFVVDTQYLIFSMLFVMC